jgi:hypothetical protein
MVQCMHAEPRHYVALSGQLHTTASLPVYLLGMRPWLTGWLDGCQGRSGCHGAGRILNARLDVFTVVFSVGSSAM